jgi:putative ABC transport system permease protein
METIWQDIRFGFRTLKKSPGFTAVAILTLALGIAANTAMFSIVNTVLIQPLPYQEPDRLVFVRDIQPQLPDLPGSYHEFLDWQEQAQIFEDTGAYWRPDVTLTGDGQPERVTSVRLTPNLLSILDLQPLLGRTLEAADDDVNAERVALLSHSLWQRRYGSSPDIVGKIIQVNSESTTIVGVLPKGMENYTPREFRRSGSNEIWLPLRLTRDTTSRGSHFLTVVSRLKPGVTLEQAQGEIERVAQAFKDDGRTNHGIMLVSVEERISGSNQTLVLLLMGAVSFVLLIACANVANLLLARATGRQKEIALRAALGASPFRLARQFLTESLLLAFAGGVGGLGLAYGSVVLFSNSVGVNLLRTGQLQLDGTVLLFTLALTLFTGILFGVGPALNATAANINETLKEGGRQPGAGTGNKMFRQALVVAEVSLSLVLLVGAGLLLRSFQNLLEVDLGFNSDNLVTYRVSLPSSKYTNTERQIQFFDSAVEKISALPGVEGVALTQVLPIVGGWNSDFDVEGLTWPEGHSPLAENRMVNPDYFRVMGIPLLQGRPLTEHDTQGSQNVVVVDAEFVRQVFGKENPLGRRIYFGGDDSPRYEIVGVVGTVQHWGIGREARPAVYDPYRQSVRSNMIMVVRTSNNPLNSVNAIRQEIFSVDSDLPISNVQTMDDVISSNLARRRLTLTLLLSFAGLALFLASIGLYGVISYSVSQRTHEIGIRMALGARAGDVLKLVISQGGKLVLLGIVIGLAGAYALTQYMESLLFGVATTDPVTFAGIPALLLAVAALACFVPARRATQVDPMVALRYE